MRLAAKAYAEFLALGGKLRFQDLTVSLLRRLLKKSLPVLTACPPPGCTRTAREREGKNGMLVYDDVAGEPRGPLRGGVRLRHGAPPRPWWPNPLLPNP